jgi:hypothetical protein
VSRCYLNSPQYEVAIGWDKFNQTFFLQVFEPDEDKIIIEMGEEPGEHQMPDHLVELARQYGRPFDSAVLVRELTLDKKTDSTRGYSIDRDQILLEKRPYAGSQKFCPHCKSDLEAGAKICRGCGAVKYSVVQDVGPATGVTTIVVLIVSGLGGPIYLFFLLIPLFIVAAGVARNDRFKGWYPR